MNSITTSQFKRVRSSQVEVHMAATSSKNISTGIQIHTSSIVYRIRSTDSFSATDAK